MITGLCCVVDIFNRTLHHLWKGWFACLSQRTPRYWVNRCHSLKVWSCSETCRLCESFVRKLCCHPKRCASFTQMHEASKHNQNNNDQIIDEYRTNQVTWYTNATKFTIICNADGCTKSHRLLVKNIGANGLLGNNKCRKENESCKSWWKINQFSAACIFYPMAYWFLSYT